ncbi:hypothetical protein GCM10018966_093550 [Streptomyces yanii]
MGDAQGTFKLHDGQRLAELTPQQLSGLQVQRHLSGPYLAGQFQSLLDRHDERHGGIATTIVPPLRTCRLGGMCGGLASGTGLTEADE